MAGRYADPDMRSILGSTFEPEGAVARFIAGREAKRQEGFEQRAAIDAVGLRTKLFDHAARVAAGNADLDWDEVSGMIMEAQQANPHLKGQVPALVSAYGEELRRLAGAAQQGGDPEMMAGVGQAPGMSVMMPGADGPQSMPAHGAMPISVAGGAAPAAAAGPGREAILDYARSIAGTPPQEAFTLGPGQVRYQGSTPIAAVPAEEDPAGIHNIPEGAIGVTPAGGIIRNPKAPESNYPIDFGVNQQAAPSLNAGLEAAAKGDLGKLNDAIRQVGGNKFGEWWKGLVEDSDIYKRMVEQAGLAGLTNSSAKAINDALNDGDSKALVEALVAESSILRKQEASGGRGDNINMNEVDFKAHPKGSFMANLVDSLKGFAWGEYSDKKADVVAKIIDETRKLRNERFGAYERDLIARVKHNLPSAFSQQLEPAAYDLMAQSLVRKMLLTGQSPKASAPDAGHSAGFSAAERRAAKEAGAAADAVLDGLLE